VKVIIVDLVNIALNAYFIMNKIDGYLNTTYHQLNTFKKKNNDKNNNILL